MNERIKHIVECALKEDVTQFAESAKAEIFERIDALKASIVSEAVERLGQEVAITESKKPCKCEEGEDPSCKCEEDEEPKKEDDELVEPEKGDEDEEKKDDESSDESDADEKKEPESDEDDDDDDDKDDEKDED